VFILSFVKLLIGVDELEGVTGVEEFEGVTGIEGEIGFDELLELFVG
jgi:hypothetical protein